MLVINRIECQIFKHIHEIRSFKYKHPVFCKQGFDSFHEILIVINMSDYIIAENNLGSPMLSENFFGHSLPKKIRNCRNSSFTGYLGNVLGRVNTQNIWM